MIGSFSPANWSRNFVPKSIICCNPNDVSLPNGPRPLALCLFSEFSGSISCVFLAISIRVSLGMSCVVQYASFFNGVIGVRSPCRCTKCTARRNKVVGGFGCTASTHSSCCVCFVELSIELVLVFLVLL